MIGRYYYKARDSYDRLEYHICNKGNEARCGNTYNTRKKTDDEGFRIEEIAYVALSSAEGAYYTDFLYSLNHRNVGYNSYHYRGNDE